MREIRPEYVHRGQTYLTASHSQLSYFCYFFQLVGNFSPLRASTQTNYLQSLTAQRVNVSSTI